MNTQKTKVLGTFSLAMITLAAIVSLRNLSFIAGLGFSAVFFLICSALAFFIPTALVVAELAAAWPHAGGCYEWVKEAFGKPLAFFTLWMSWMASVTWFPTILLFTAAMLGSMLEPFFPTIQDNQLFFMICMLTIFWGTTFLNFLGVEFYGFISSFGVILGTIIPGAIIILLGIAWVNNANSSHITISASNLIPSLSLDNLTLCASVLLSLAGIELAAYHIREAKDPQKTYPRALLIAACIILLIYILGTLSIAIVVPQNELSLATGLIQAFGIFFLNLNMPIMLPIMAACLLLGALAGINAWVAGPAKGMLIVANDGFFPKWLQHVNKKNVPTALLFLQATIGSILSILFVYSERNTFMWILTALSAQFTCLVYILIFAACLRLRYKAPTTKRPFKVKAIWLFVTLGMIACLFGFFIVYIPHSQYVFMQQDLYNKLLIVIFAALLLPPILLIKYRHWSNGAAK